ncbi:glycosyltransferase family 4 protein [Cyanobium usitatum]|nr:glycosyltransferase family 4 protein [Cyanobium usitatum]
MIYQNTIIQLCRELPPGYGGVERVAHELATHLLTRYHRNIISYSFNPAHCEDPFTVDYSREVLPCILIGQLLLPRPSSKYFTILLSPCPLIIHLPCPTILLLAVFAKIIRPNRKILVYWHAFLESKGMGGLFLYFYQMLALVSINLFDIIVTTSPALADSLRIHVKNHRKVQILPCCIHESQEHSLSIKLTFRSTLSHPILSDPSLLKLIAIGRLESYKRIDWLLSIVEKCNQVLKPRGNEIHLDIIGEGRSKSLLQNIVSSSPFLEGSVYFHGRVSEDIKQELLFDSDMLVLMAGSCNEAFGIVQLEAMALGIPSVSLYNSKSGSYWVSNTSSQNWNGSRSSMHDFLLNVARDKTKLSILKTEASSRYRKHFSRTVWNRNFENIFNAFVES